jgi:sugar phosphate isomerase/epimerase
MQRRKFISNTAAAGLVIPLSVHALPGIASSINKRKTTPFVCMFSKHLQWLDYDDMAGMAKKLGFDGIDLTVRPGGHVLPERVERDLPKAVEAIRKKGLSIPMITTRILEANHPITHKILRTAGNLGIQVYRTGWWRYRGEPVMSLLKDKNKEMKELAEINQKYGIKGAYQNHAGNYVGAPCWDLLELLDGVPPEWMGVQFDIRHAHVEGAMSWPQNLEILAPYINSIDIKDYRWEKENESWILKNVPLGEGMVDFDTFFKLLYRFTIKADFSIHYEYPLGGADHGKKELTIAIDEFEDIVGRDLQYFKNHFTIIERQ